MRAQPPRPAWRGFVARHLFVYLVILAAVVVGVSVVLAREELSAAVHRLEPHWIPLVLGLSLFNYLLRFVKWHRLLRDAGIDVPVLANARLYFSCLAMVVTPARLGELYKIVFLRKLHGIPGTRALPPLVLERVTDALAVLALVTARSGSGVGAVLAVVGSVVVLIAVGAWLSHPRWRAWMLSVLRRVRPLRSRAESIERGLAAHAVLLRPKSLAPSLALSTLSWWAECVGLWVLCRGLAEAVDLTAATWIYAASTLLGNLTFLPGGLGGTEVSLFAFLRHANVTAEGAIAATALVRAATLWFAVLVGASVTFAFRRSLRWKEVTEEAAIDTVSGQ